MAALHRAVRQFFAAVPGSLRNHLNFEELARIAVTALTAGGGMFGVLEAVLRQAQAIFPAPADAALATALLTLILEVSRRLQHGDDPASLTSARRCSR
jgi:cobalamin synthase